VATHVADLEAYGAVKGTFDVVIEASGNEAALCTALNVIRPRGILTLLGLGGDVTLPLNQLVAKEIQMRGNFRFHEEFNWAVKLIGDKRIPLEPLLTGVYSINDVMAAFDYQGLAEGALDMGKTHGAAVVAHVHALIVRGLAAILATPAGTARINRHQIPHRKALHTLTQGGDAAGHLVAENHRLLDANRAKPAIVVIMQVGSADPSRFHLDKGLTFTGSRDFGFFYPQVFWTMANY